MRCLAAGFLTAVTHLTVTYVVIAGREYSD